MLNWWWCGVPAAPLLYLLCTFVRFSNLNRFAASGFRGCTLPVPADANTTLRSKRCFLSYGDGDDDVDHKAWLKLVNYNVSRWSYDNDVDMMLMLTVMILIIKSLNKMSQCCFSL